ncbi:T9SS type A sorting domain-containing protein [Polaribacter sp.]|nr:T9SS type A sorting domain-containing protein [Polaribacter sp.]
MKKNYFFTFILTLCFSAISFAQTQPTVHNSSFDKIAKAEGSDCSCAGWINKSLADQGESSTTDGNDVVKFDNLESDGIYQEVAVEANSDYTLDLDVKWTSTDTTTEYLEIVVLKGSGYVADYTPAYAGPAEAAQDDFGYRTVESADLASNQLSKSNLTVPGDTGMNAITTISFNTGTETSIAIFIRAVGPYDSDAHEDSGKDKGWMNGDTELRVDNFSLVNLGEPSTTNTLFIAETFDYDDGTTLISTDGWANFSGTEGQILVNSGEIQLKDTDAEDADNNFPDGPVTGDVYYAFDITVTKPASVSGSDFEYFALLRPVGSNSFKARLDVAEFTETGFKFGIHSSAGTAEVLWGSELSYTETHRIVVRYSTTVGDTQLWVNASDDSSASIITTTTSTIADIGAFAFRQSSSSPDFIHTIDNLAVGSAFDDVLNFPATSTTPSIAITAPTDGATLASTTTSVTVSVSTTDFAVGAIDAGLDGHIHWSIQENSDAAVDQAMKYDTNDETISVTAGNSYTVFMELRDNSHQPLSPEVNTTITFTVAAPVAVALPLDFETATTWADFNGGAVTTVSNPDTSGNSSANVGKMVKNAGEPWGGSSLVLDAAMDFTTNDTFTMKVWSPRVGATVLLKVEDSNAPTTNHEVSATTTVASEWETLTFDYSAINTANSYDKLVLIFDNGTMGDGSDNYTFYIDDIELSAAPVAVELPLDFETATTWADFNGGAVTTVSNPDTSGNSSANVGKMVKNAGEPWGGSSLVLDAAMDFTTNDTFTMKVWSPRVGATVLLKVEDSNAPTTNHEVSATTTVASEWETLTFDYSAINTANSYDKLVLIFDNGTMGDGSDNYTFYIDDIELSGETAGIDDQDLVSLNMYPNPASDVLNISAQNTINTVEIYNVLGQKVIRMNIEDTSAEINVSNLNAGIYLIKYEINNRTSTKKFVKN